MSDPGIKTYMLQNPKRLVKQAQINIIYKGYATLVVSMKGSFTDLMGTYKSLNGAKIGFGKHFYTGAEWKEEKL